MLLIYSNEGKFTSIFSTNVLGTCVIILIMKEVILHTVSICLYTYERGKAGVKLLSLTHLQTKAPNEADMTPGLFVGCLTSQQHASASQGRVTPGFRTEHFCSPTNVSKPLTNMSWPGPDFARHTHRLTFGAMMGLKYFLARLSVAMGNITSVISKSVSPLVKVKYVLPIREVCFQNVFLLAFSVYLV